MPRRDTTAGAEAVQAAVHRRQTPAQRLRSAIELSDFTHGLVLARVKRAHPDCTDAQANRLVAEMLYGKSSRS